MIASSDATNSSALKRSNRAVGSRCSGTRSGAPITTIAMIGTATRNVASHPYASSSSPLSSGPSATPAEMPPAHIPIATPRCFASENSTKINPSVAGNIIAPARPRTARQTIISDGSVVSAAAMETTANKIAPITIRRRLPTRSPSTPIATRNPAITKP